MPDGQLALDAMLCPLTELLDAENRWVRRALLIPWEALEQALGQRLYARTGAPAKPLRLMLGAYIVRQTLRLSDAEALRQIQESPYLQHFIGCHCFEHEPPFSVSTLADFRRRLDLHALRTIRRAVSPVMREVGGGFHRRASNAEAKGE